MCTCSPWHIKLDLGLLGTRKMSWPSFWHARKHSTYMHCSDIVALFLVFSIFETQSNEVTLQRGGQGSLESEALCREFARTLHVPRACSGEPQAGKPNISGRWLGFSLPSPWLHCLFCVPLLKCGSFWKQMDWYTEYLWREVPENSATKPGKSTNWEEARSRFQWNISLMLERASLSCWNVLNSL